MLNGNHILLIRELLPDNLLGGVSRDIEKRLLVFIKEVSKTTPSIITSLGSKSKLITDVISEKQINLREFMRYMVANGSKDEKREILAMIRADIILKNKQVFIGKNDATNQDISELGGKKKKTKNGNIGESLSLSVS